MISTWTSLRLGRLFERYRVRYWPRSRRLRHYTIAATSLKEAYGECDYAARVLWIDVAIHRSDREVRATVLHEMAHAVVGRGGHRARFWAQLEYLLSRRAPVTIAFPELGEQSGHLGVIPRRFRRCRRLFRPVYERWQRELECRCAGLPSINVTPALLASRLRGRSERG